MSELQFAQVFAVKFIDSSSVGIDFLVILSQTAHAITIQLDGLLQCRHFVGISSL